METGVLERTGNMERRDGATERRSDRATERQRGKGEASWAGRMEQSLRETATSLRESAGLEKSEVKTA
jgi:hypothetical protein